MECRIEYYGLFPLLDSDSDSDLNSNSKPIDYIVLLPPATKLGQGYVFTCVCASVQGGGSPGPHPGGEVEGSGCGVSRPTPRVSPSPHLGGIQHALRQTPPKRWLLLWAVCILLECILVQNMFPLTQIQIRIPFPTGYCTHFRDRCMS